MIRFTEHEVELTGSAQELEEAAREFQARNVLRLPGLLAPGFREMIRHGIDQDGFDDGDEPTPGSAEPRFVGAYQHGKVGQDLRTGETTHVIKQRANDPVVFDFVGQMLGFSGLGQCVGRIFRLMPSQEDLPWHTDAEGGRVADLIIDLATEPFDGGLFQMRETASKEIMSEVGQLKFGDGLLIRLSPDIEHHYKAVTGSVAKNLFSGWFAPLGVE